MTSGYLTHKSFLFTSLLAVFLGIGVHMAAGQGCGPGACMYDPKTETTIMGVIQEVKAISGPGRGTGTHLVVKTESGLIEVHVGPSWYLKQQNCQFKKDDQVEILGSKVKFEGADVLIARQMKSGDKAWTLRDAQGIPAWSQGRNR